MATLGCSVGASRIGHGLPRAHTMRFARTGCLARFRLSRSRWMASIGRRLRWCAGGRATHERRREAVWEGKILPIELDIGDSSICSERRNQAIDVPVLEHPVENDAATQEARYVSCDGLDAVLHRHLVGDAVGRRKRKRDENEWAPRFGIGLAAVLGWADLIGIDLRDAQPGRSRIIGGGPIAGQKHGREHGQHNPRHHARTRMQPERRLRGETAGPQSRHRCSHLSIPAGIAAGA